MLKRLLCLLVFVMVITGCSQTTFEPKGVNPELWIFKGNFKWEMTKKQFQEEAGISGYQFVGKRAGGRIIKYEESRNIFHCYFSPQNRLIYIKIDIRTDPLLLLADLKDRLGEPETLRTSPPSRAYEWKRKGDGLLFLVDLQSLTYYNSVLYKEKLQYIQTIQLKEADERLVEINNEMKKEREK